MKKIRTEVKYHISVRIDGSRTEMCSRELQKQGHDQQSSTFSPFDYN
jgi:hypothetical protein